MTDKIQTTQAELDKVFRRMERDYGALNNRQQAYAIREIGRVRGEIAEMLADFSGSDGKIKRQRMSRVLRELDIIERAIRDEGMDTLGNIIEESSEWTVEKLASVAGIAGATVAATNEYVIKYIAKRFDGDGLVMSDRVWRIAGDLRDELSKVIRSSILRGDSINDIIPRVREVFSAESWKIRRLVRTESVTAHRAATSYNAQESDIVKWVRLHEGTCGRKDHHKHKCHILANEDRYGEGKGIFKPTDTDIWLPHPNCTSWIAYVIDERWL